MVGFRISTVDASKILVDLDTAITKAEKSTSLTFAEALDAIIGVADSVTTLSDSYGKLQKVKP